MFQLRAEHQQAFFQAVRTPFHRRILAFIRRTTPESIAGQREPELLRRIAAVDQKATAFGLRTECGITQFVALTFLVGRDLDEFPPVVAYLNLPRPDPDSKVAILVNALKIYKEREAAREGKRPTQISQALEGGKRILGAIFAFLLYPFMPCVGPLQPLAAGAGNAGEVVLEGEVAETVGLGVVGELLGDFALGVIAVITAPEFLIGAIIVLGALVALSAISKMNDASKDESKDDAPSETQECPKRFTPEQSEIIKKAKKAKKTGLTEEEAKDLVDEAQKAGLPARGPEAHPGRPFGQNPHIHVGPVNHIPIK